MKWLFVLLLLGTAFAEDFTRIVETEVGHLDVSGVNSTDGVYELEGTTHNFRITATREFTLLNYSVHLSPRNLERIAEDFDMPLSGTTEIQVHPAEVGDTLELPDIVCGDYSAEVDAYYSVNGTMKHFGDEIALRIPCRDLRSRFVSGLFSILPYPLLKMFAGWAGLRIG
jgi:hypothetical protein